MRNAWRRVGVGLAMVATIVAGAFFGCARPGERVAEKAVNELLAQEIGPADAWKTRVKADCLGALIRGRVRSVRIDGVNVRLSGDLTLATLAIDAEEIEVDRQKRTLTRVGVARFDATITDAALDRLARANRPKLADLRVRLRGRFVTVKVTPEIFGHPTVAIDVDGSLIPQNGGATLDFEPDSARLKAISIPGPILDFVAGKVNPIVDLADLKLPIRVRTARVEGNVLRMTGTIPPELLPLLAR